MTLVNARAAFEKAVTDAVVAADNTVSVVYDNVTFVTPGKAKKYVVMNLNFTQSTLQNQGASRDYYSGVVQCNVYVPKSKGTSVLSAISESVIDGLTSVNASNYSDTFSVKPRVQDINGPVMLEIEDRSHFVGVISCQFSANA
jgi:triacylglycerol esterase/lipase EstA (alpha/beta hydrolase family)